MAFFGKKPPAVKPVTAPKPATPAQGVEVPRPELSSLDFTVGGGDMVRALAQAADSINVEEIGGGMSAAAEEAAVLYANGSVEHAEQVLASLLDGEGGAHAGEGMWMMLLDLYRLSGQRARFDQRVIDYATRFEKSPPPWVDLSNQSRRELSDKVPLVNLAGNLSGQAAKQFSQIGVIGRKGGAIRIDLARLRSIDDEGCGLLRSTLAELVREKVKVQLLTVQHVADMLANQVNIGEPERQDTWLLLLECMQYCNDQERFEQYAVDYAITFEVSPPSWEGRGEGAPEAVQAAEADAVPADTFVLEGELAGNNHESIRRLAAFAGTRRAVTVDCQRLRRLDFVGAGTLFNILATLQAQGKLVVFENVNAMVAALLRVMGVDQVAQVTLRA
jgi:anti-anti-sigma regulatory factor